MSTTTTTFWLADPKILFAPAEVSEVFPRPASMSIEQQLNSLTRLLLLVTAVLSAVTGGDWRVLVVTALTLAAVCVFYKYNYGRIRPAAAATEAAGQRESYQNRVVDAMDLAGQQKGISDALFDHAQLSNPFGNVLLTDYVDNPTKKPAEPAHNDNFLKNSSGVVIDYEDTVLKEAKQLVIASHPDQPDLVEKLFTDMSDNYIFEQSLRPFYSNPSTTIPNDQGGFADFCYGSMISCKDGNLFACARNLPISGARADV